MVSFRDLYVIDLNQVQFLRLTGFFKLFFSGFMTVTTLFLSALLSRIYAQLGLQVGTKNVEIYKQY